MSEQLRRWLIPLVVVGSLVVGGIAVAALDEGTSEPTTASEEPTTEPTVEPTGPETETPAAETPEDGTEDGAEEPEEGIEEGEPGVERYWGEECGETVLKNHGQYVKAAEKGGEARSQAAQSPCGKPIAAV